RRDLTRDGRAPAIVAAAPELDLPVMQLDGVHLSFPSVSGKTYVLQVSTDLVNWTFLANLAAAGPLTTYTDHVTASTKLRFYRIVQQ
ncbi:MAG TPA: hypothetical protein VHH73_10200, partial [Verrucomicrobiae bacterium]|nr:hypothetical protein [Verrucomicrobiae bacterium]